MMCLEKCGIMVIWQRLRARCSRRISMRFDDGKEGVGRHDPDVFRLSAIARGKIPPCSAAYLLFLFF